MVDNFLKLYPQYNQIPVRNNQSLPSFGVNNSQSEKTNNNYENSPDKDTFQKANKTNKQGENVLHDTLCVIPGTRRVMSIIDSNDNGNAIKAMGLAGIMLLNIREDYRDILSVFGRVKVDSKPGYISRFKFFTGTPLEAWAKEQVKKGNDKWDVLLGKWDKNLGDTKWAQKLLKKMGVEPDIKVARKEVKYLFAKPEVLRRKYVNFTGPKLGKFIGFTLERIPKISVVVAALLEIPLLVKNLKKENSAPKAVAKSATNVAFGVTGGAAMSVLLTKLGDRIHPGLGSVGSVFGIGIGALLANKAAEKINSKY